MPRRYLTEPQAWREIARRIVEGEWSKSGLCREANVLLERDRVNDCVFVRMMDRIDDHIQARNNSIDYRPDCGFSWAYEFGTEPEARAFAALWLALEAEEEAKAEARKLVQGLAVATIGPKALRAMGMRT